MKILVIDNLFAPNLEKKISNGAQKFSRNQFNLLNNTYYITAKGSDQQHPSQFVLDNYFDLSLEDKKDKVKQTKMVSAEIQNIIARVNPDVVLDNSCKHLSSAWDSYKNGIVFEHYHKPSMILTPDIKTKFEKKNVYWCGVSKFQANKFNNYFHDTINIHYIDEYPSKVEEAQPYGVFVGRWDAGKSPHVALKNYLKSGCKYKVKCYIKIAGKKIPEKELEALQNSDLFEFHIDAPREEILEAMAGAMFGLGMGNESTGIVGLEYATFGVPYIVPGNKTIAEMEHLPPEAIMFCDRNKDQSLPDQIKQYVDHASIISYNDRCNLSKSVIEKYNKERFVAEHMRIIEAAKKHYAKDNLECFMT